MMMLVAGRTANAGSLFTNIDDTEFADWTTVPAASENDQRLVCSLYEPILKECIEDIEPIHAVRYADLGREVAVNSEFGGWSYLFELPSDYLSFLAQVGEGDREIEYEAEPLPFDTYSHVVAGDDDQSYYCSTSHASVDDSSDGKPTGNDGNVNWTLYNTDATFGAKWYADKVYSTASDGILLASNTFSNDAGTAAYIKYLAYVQAGFADKPGLYSEAFKAAFACRLAAAMALDSKDYKRRTDLLTEYERLHKPAARRIKARPTPKKDRVTILEAMTRQT